VAKRKQPDKEQLDKAKEVLRQSTETMGEALKRVAPEWWEQSIFADDEQTTEQPQSKPTAAPVDPPPEANQTAAAAEPTVVENRAAVRKAFLEPLLRKKGWTLNRLAAVSGAEPRTVYDYVKGKSSLRPDTRNILAQALGIEESTLPE